MTAVPTNRDEHADDPRYGDVDPETRRIIRAKANRLARSPGFWRHEVEDLEQDLLLALLRRREKFDPVRGCWPAFVTTVVAHAAVSLLRHRRAACRDPRRREHADLSLCPIGLSNSQAVELLVDLSGLAGPLSAADRAALEELLLGTTDATPAHLEDALQTIRRVLTESDDCRSFLL